ncbi:hypothetical protein EMIHUDRAFT_218075 [Emiliania huxleyi CCMP1516]|uniref:Auxin efflux carrier n=3 Tax=Emiliania huxleyi TaxID=2903 RepID=A0A0D3I9T1_EMIH1|nr:hypothetical protein EMIHUDRAFT_218075 [Emiliania huxleyi CCMP1516]EOD08016.1 hypothetical protein EMIHUDRAFT_218075 [Emiliania huxleyi CCMP1516]|eukprot:XP_005760445.1 hypothetical protein EMIHUDRAFT_218075 [Emiliania huxleyi CCMP1516]
MAATDVSWRALGTLTAAKMVVMPAFGAATGIALRSSGLVRQPAAVLVAMIVTCTPTANNVMVMAELAGESREALAAAIFVQYAFAPFSITLWLYLYIHIATGGS